MRKRGWMLLLILLCVAFLMSCGKDTRPDEAKGELVRKENIVYGMDYSVEREGNLNWNPSFCFLNSYEITSVPC